MKLWTWQNPRFSLANKQQKVESIEYSVYLNDPTNSKKAKEHHKAAYQKIWKRLGTDQILWCFTQYEDAIDDASIMEFEKDGCLLWDIDAPEDKIIKYCIAAWECLRTGEPCNPFDRSWLDLKAFKPDKWDKLVKDFKEYWKGKSEQQLLEAMFLEKLVNGCSEAIVFHPVERIERNPEKESKWWKKTTYKTNSSEGEEIMPCARCPGRAGD